MDKLIVEGGHKLSGSITISGAKNACLPILAGSLLTDDSSSISNVPDLKDVFTMVDILNSLGRKVEKTDSRIEVSKGEIKSTMASYDLVSTMRASVAVLGPLLGRYGEARVSFPGGCVIGPRPIDLHLKGLRALGADIKIEEGYIVAKAKKLKGTKISLSVHAVLVECNLRTIMNNIDKSCLSLSGKSSIFYVIEISVSPKSIDSILEKINSFKGISSWFTIESVSKIINR